MKGRLQWNRMASASAAFNSYSHIDTNKRLEVCAERANEGS